MADYERHYGSCVAVSGQGVLLRGPSRAGKSDLALRLIDGGAQLVADDQCLIEPGETGLCVSAPESLAGLLEVHGLGIIKQPTTANAPLGLVVDLVERAQEPLLPPPGDPFEQTVICGAKVPRLALWAFGASTPAKIRLAIYALQHGAVATDMAIKPR